MNITAAYIAIMIICSIALIMLFIRLIQPQVVYWFREALLEAKANRAFLYLEEGDISFDLQDVLIQAFRPEGELYDSTEIYDRVTKIREIFRVLRQKVDNNHDYEGSSSYRRVNICVVELANIIRSMGWRLVPNKSYRSPVISAEEVLEFLIKTRTGGLGYEGIVGEYLRERPITIEEINEILIAVIYSMLYRIQASR